MSTAIETNTSLLDENLINLSQAGRRFPRTRQGRSPHPTPSAVWRWVRDGVLAPDGRRVRLEALFLAGRWLTSVEAISRFALAQQPADALGVEITPTVEVHAPGIRARAAEKAGQELQRLGL